MRQELRGHCVPFQTLVLPSQAGTWERKGVPRATILPEPKWGRTRLAEGLRDPAGLLQTSTPRRAAKGGFPPGFPRSPQRAKQGQKKEPFGLRRLFVITRLWTAPQSHSVGESCVSGRWVVGMWMGLGAVERIKGFGHLWRRLEFELFGLVWCSVFWLLRK